MLTLSLLVLLKALILTSIVAAENDLIECPKYVHIHRKTVNASIICYISDRSVVEHLVFISEGYPPLPLNSASDRFSFFELNDTAVEILMDHIVPEKDYRNTISLKAKTASQTIESNIYINERGQGKVPFGWYDYLIFALILLVSAGIGVYFGFIKDHEHNQENYMLGGRKMGWLPASLSLLASFMSAITLLGTPSEIFTFGTQYLMIALAYPVVAALSVHVFLPIFHDLRLTSAYEYLELRFSRIVRVFGAAIFVLQMVIYMSMVVFMPSIALEAVTGLNFWFSALTTTVVCIFYTSFG